MVHIVFCTTEHYNRCEGGEINMREKYKEEIESLKKDIGENKDISSIKAAVDQAYQDAKENIFGNR